MKKLLPLILSIVLCFIFSSCGNTSIKGDLKSYSNADKSFSIELPASNDESWVINEKSPSSILDISDNEDTVNLRIQCISKSQIHLVAPDLNGYKDYSFIWFQTIIRRPRDCTLHGKRKMLLYIFHYGNRQSIHK